MSRDFKKVPKLEITDIRGTEELPSEQRFSSRLNANKWLPSILGSAEQDKTFTLKGKNIAGDNSSKSIWSTIDFSNQSSIGAEEFQLNLKRFYLALYCLRHGGYAFSGITDVIDYSTDNNLYSKSIEKFLKDFQMGNGPSEFTTGLTVENVRTYRGDKATVDDSDSLDDKEIAKIKDYSRATDNKYEANIASALGKVTYDAIVKNTFFYLLKENELIPGYKERTVGWTQEALKLEPEKIDYHIDITGGPYYRAYPVVCVYIKAKNDTKKEEIISKANALLTSKFIRNVTDKQLVSQIVSNKTNKSVGADKSFVQIKNEQSGYSIFCAIYDFAKIFVLPVDSGDSTLLGILKICLSLFSRIQIEFDNVAQISQKISQIRDFLNASFGETLEDKDYSIFLKNKHTEELNYSLKKEKSSIKPKLSKEFKIQLSLILKTLETAYSNITGIINSQIKPGENQNSQFINYPADYESKIVFHFDNFYNLLAITSKPTAGVQKKKEYPQDVPFILEEYEISYAKEDLIPLFFKDVTTLKKYPEKDPAYGYSPDIALNQDIVLVTDVFLRQAYENLDSTGAGLKYETVSNSKKDDVLSIEPGKINLLQEIKTRVSEAYKKNSNSVKEDPSNKITAKEDYFFISGDRVYLKKEVVKKLELDEIKFLFESVQEDKIRFQTINHLYHVNIEELKKKKIRVEDFTDLIYYPLIRQLSGPTPDQQKPRKPGTPRTPQKNKKNDLLINNIISSELACYEDISNSFDKALNAETFGDTVYYLAQTITNIGLPILLAYASQQIAEKIKKLKNTKDPTLLECLLNDSENLKKFILGYADLFSNSDPLSLLMQAIPELPKIPPVAYLFTFDAEKELKRRLVKAIIKSFSSFIKKQLDLSLEVLLDMCNADSYLNALLSSIDTKKGNNLGAPSASGLPSKSVATTNKPSVTANINNLIDISNIETRENIYEDFRFLFISEEEASLYDNNSISEFFDFLSETTDVGRMVTLLKGTSSLETRSTILSYIKNYEINSETNNGKYEVIFGDSQSIAYLFLFLGKYIDYRLLLELLSQVLNNFTPTVCLDINSILDDIKYDFSQDEIDDTNADLEKTLDELCKAKYPKTFDILASGPALLTRRLNKTLNNAMESVINGVSSIFIVSETAISSTTDTEEIKKIRNSYDYVSIYDYTTTGVIPEFSKFKSKISNDLNVFVNEKYKSIDEIAKAYLNINEIIDQDIFKDFISINNKVLNYNEIKEQFKKDLLSAGNIGLKTEESSILGYNEKYREFLQNKSQIY